MNIPAGDIGNALHSVAPEHVVAITSDIYDQTMSLYQDEINQQLSSSTVNLSSSVASALNTKLPKSGGTISGDLTVTGNFIVNGTSSIINTQDLAVKDRLILLASGSTSTASADGAGIAIQTASAATTTNAEKSSARIQYVGATNRFTSSVDFQAPRFRGNLVGTASKAVTASFALTAAFTEGTASYALEASKVTHMLKLTGSVNATYNGASDVTVLIPDPLEIMSGSTASIAATASWAFYANEAGNADKLDGTHKVDLFTQFVRSGSNLALGEEDNFYIITVGDTLKSASMQHSHSVVFRSSGKKIGITVAGEGSSLTPPYASVAEYATSSTTATSASYTSGGLLIASSASVGAVQQVISSNSASWAANTKVTSAANHYTSSGMVSGTLGSSTGGIFLKTITTDKAGHITACTSGAASSDIQVTEDSSSNVKYNIVWENGSNGLCKTSTKLNYYPSLSLLVNAGEIRTAKLTHGRITGSKTGTVTLVAGNTTYIDTPTGAITLITESAASGQEGIYHCIVNMGSTLQSVTVPGTLVEGSALINKASCKYEISICENMTIIIRT